uniref:endonuclease 8-like 1 isoform X2 n=1 Tax=Podarcis muralis TaxID=64176 RepID=UPI00109FA3D5|nr:endonuclease 8-like 1 isoform X2 [Podarcis muralis]
MPEGPELFLNSRYINEECGGLLFSGKVEKSEVSKNPEVPFESDRYLISAVSRGKELRLTLTPLKQEGPAPSKRRVSAARGKQAAQEPMDIIFRFGMSGNFKFVPVSEMPKHAHLRFYTRGSPPRVLCFVDFRRFGRWEVSSSWQVDRGPCVMLEYEKFRENVLRNLSDKAFDKPICEALLNQKFFNGVGNYLRAEILYRLKIPPFEKARTVLEDLKPQEQVAKVMIPLGRLITPCSWSGLSAISSQACRPCVMPTAGLSGSRALLDQWPQKVSIGGSLDHLSVISPGYQYIGWRREQIVFDPASHRAC